MILNASLQTRCARNRLDRRRQSDIFCVRFIIGFGQTGCNKETMKQCDEPAMSPADDPAGSESMINSVLARA